MPRAIFCAGLIVALPATTSPALTLGWWNFEGDGTPLTEAADNLELSLVKRYENFRVTDSFDWPPELISANDGVGGSMGAFLPGDDILLGVEITNAHPTDSFQLEEFRFSLRSEHPIGFLLATSGDPSFFEIDDGIFADDPSIFTEFSFPLDLIGDIHILAPGQTIAFGIASFGGPEPARVDDLILIGTGPTDPQRLPDTEIQPISSIERTAAGTRITIPPAFRRNIGVEYSHDLSKGSWVALGNFFEEGEIAVFVDPDPARRDSPEGYYRAFLRPLDP